MDDNQKAAFCNPSIPHVHSHTSTQKDIYVVFLCSYEFMFAFVFLPLREVESFKLSFLILKEAFVNSTPPPSLVLFSSKL